MIVLAVGCVAWAFVVWQWNDPFTSLYTRWQQHKLKGVYAQVVRTYHPIPIPPARQTKTVRRREARILAAEARRYRLQRVKTGAPIGRIVVPRLGLHMLLINGTDHDSLVKGPGRDDRSYMPGQGQLVYIAGHRTTYLAPFAHIDSLRAGDLVTLKMPLRDDRLLRHGPRHRRRDTTWRCCSRTTARSWRSRRATRGSSPPIATSCGRSLCG